MSYAWSIAYNFALLKNTTRWKNAQMLNLTMGKIVMWLTINTHFQNDICSQEQESSRPTIVEFLRDSPSK